MYVCIHLNIILNHKLVRSQVKAAKKKTKFIEKITSKKEQKETKFFGLLLNFIKH